MDGKRIDFKMPKVYLSWLIYSITNSVTSIININTEHVIFGILVACYGQQCFTISIMKYGAHFFFFLVRACQCGRSADLQGPWLVGLTSLAERLLKAIVRYRNRVHLEEEEKKGTKNKRKKTSRLMRRTSPVMADRNTSQSTNHRRHWSTTET